MGILRRVGTALLGMALLLAIAVAGSRAASNVYFMAVNERFVEMTPENMPMSVNGALYVPYIMLSIQHTTPPARPPWSPMASGASSLICKATPPTTPRVTR